MKSFALVGISSLCMLCSCGNSVASEDVVFKTDSVVCAKTMGKNIECKMIADYPTGDSKLAHSVANYVSGELAKLYLPNVNEQHNEKEYPFYSGDTTDGKVVVNYYVDGTLKFLKSLLNDIYEADARSEVLMSQEIDVRKTDDNDRYVSYRTFSYIYLGGAHGTTIDHTMNIDKRSGEPLMQIVDTLQTEAMQPLLRRGVVEYLRKQGETSVTDTKLNDILFLEKGIIPVPRYAPYLTDDGVHFVYQQYEIGPYAIGLVEFVVPYADIKPYMVKEALQLMPQ